MDEAIAQVIGKGLGLDKTRRPLSNVERDDDPIGDSVESTPLTDSD